MEDLSKHLPLMEVGESVRLQFGDIVTHLDKISVDCISLWIMDCANVPNDFVMDICQVNVTLDGGKAPVTTKQWQDWIQSTKYVPDHISIEQIPDDVDLDGPIDRTPVVLDLDI